MNYALIAGRDFIYLADTEEKLLHKIVEMTNRSYADVENEYKNMGVVKYKAWFYEIRSVDGIL